MRLALLLDESRRVHQRPGSAWAQRSTISGNRMPSSINQTWDEFTFGKPSELVAFDETGDVRTLYPTDRDQFFAAAIEPD